MKRTIFCAGILLTGVSVNAQHHFGAFADAGLSLMNSKTLKVDEERGVTLNSGFQPSFAVGLSYLYQFDQLNLETGIQYNVINGATQQEFSISINDGPINNVTTLMDRGAHYLNVPLIVNYTIDVLSVGLGASGGFLMTNSYHFASGHNGAPGILVGGGNDLARFDFGLNAQLSCEILENLSIQGRAYLGLNNIESDVEETILSSTYGLSHVADRSLRNRQVTLGLKYMFGTDK